MYIELGRVSSFRDRLEGVLERALTVSGDESRESVGEGVFRVSELVLSAIDGVLDGGPRTLFALRTEKKVGDAFDRVPPAAGGEAALPAELETLSRALIRCEMLEPTWGFFARGSACC